MTHAVVDSPLGRITLVSREGVLAGLYLEDAKHRPPVEGPRDDTALPAVREQLEAYWARELTVFELPLGLTGTPFQQEVWTALAQIPYGRTWTYGQLAATLGKPGASRAVGLANGRNPVCLVLPCHRVIGADGSLTGYAGGVERKRWLLDHEAGINALV